MGENGNGYNREVAQRIARFWIDNRFAINWTAGKEGDEAKRCTVKGWPETEPLSGELGSVAGFVAERLKTRNPVVVLRPSGLVGVECDSQQDAEQLATFGLPPTLTARSSERWKLHLYFRAPAEDVPYAAFRFESGALSADSGRYFVTPPALHPSGVSYEWVNGAGIATLPSELYERLVEAAGASRRQRAEVAANPDAIILRGHRTKHIEQAAGSDRRFGLPLEDATAKALKINATRFGSDPLPEAKVRETVAGIYGRYPDGIAAGAVLGSSVGFNPSMILGSSEYDVGDAPPTSTVPELHDLGLAEHFAATYGRHFRNVNENRRWIYCRGGRWYEATGDKAAEQAAMRMLRKLPELADEVPDDKREGFLKFAARATRRGQRDSLLNVAESLPQLMIGLDRLDRHPMLLACRNGTLELENGRLRDHNPDDLLTRGSPVSYDPDAKAPRWQQFLREIFLEDEELIGYIQRVVGYCLTGDIREETLWVLYGTGGNGKTKLCMAVRAILGSELFQMARFDTFTVNKHEQIPVGIARMDRTRLVVASENHASKRLNESTIKALTGGEPITARYMRENEFEFVPQFKLWLVANDKPGVTSTDAGIRRRVRMIPFKADFAGREDTTLERALAAEAPGILAWAVQGCLTWQRDGLGSCIAVDEATAEYMAEMNPLADWAEEELIFAPQLVTAGARLREAYDGWCDRRGMRRLHNRDYRAAFEALGAEHQKTKSANAWRGVGLKNSPQLDDFAA
jgi:P4 family phage/plasmid primase-like protien